MNQITSLKRPYLTPKFCRFLLRVLEPTQVIHFIAIHHQSINGAHCLLALEGTGVACERDRT